MLGQILNCDYRRKKKKLLEMLELDGETPKIDFKVETPNLDRTKENKQNRRNELDELCKDIIAIYDQIKEEILLSIRNNSEPIINTKSASNTSPINITSAKLIKIFTVPFNLVNPLYKFYIYKTEIIINKTNEKVYSCNAIFKIASHGGENEDNTLISSSDINDDIVGESMKKLFNYGGFPKFIANFLNVLTFKFYPANIPDFKKPITLKKSQILYIFLTNDILRDARLNILLVQFLFFIVANSIIKFLFGFIMNNNWFHEYFSFNSNNTVSKDSPLVVPSLISANLWVSSSSHASVILSSPSSSREWIKK